MTITQQVSERVPRLRHPNKEAIKATLESVGEFRAPGAWHVQARLRDEAQAFQTAFETGAGGIPVLSMPQPNQELVTVCRALYAQKLPATCMKGRECAMPVEARIGLPVEKFSSRDRLPEWCT